jgi:hypothetical protein
MADFVEEEVTLVSIDEKLNLILRKLEDLDRRMILIEKNVGKMDGHIDFVESVYNSVKSPFHRVMNMIQGSSHVPLIE